MPRSTGMPSSLPWKWVPGRRWRGRILPPSNPILTTTALSCWIAARPRPSMLDKLLSVLADGCFHSGSELGRALGISRSAVWKHMQRLQELGLEVYNVKGRGYRLPGGVDLIDPARLYQYLQVDGVSGQLARLDVAIETDSTNAQGLQALQQGIPNGLFVAEYQHAGRGRRGRQWLSPLASSLCF